MGEPADGGAAARGVAAALRQVEASARALRDAGQVDESWGAAATVCLRPP